MMLTFCFHIAIRQIRGVGVVVVGGVGAGVSGDSGGRTFILTFPYI